MLPDKSTDSYSHFLTSLSDVCPLIALLPDKATDSYSHFLTALSDVCLLIATTAIVNFETAINNTQRRKWPDMTIVGCRFHLRQAWYRQIQHLGLQKTNAASTSSTGETIISAGGRWLRYVFGLTFLDPSEVYDAFTSDLLPIRPNRLKLEKYTEYLLNNYILDDAKFPL